VTGRAGLLQPGKEWHSGATWIDYDRDGKLDLFVATYLDFDPNKIPKPGAGEYCRYMDVPVNCGPRGLTPTRHKLYRNNGDGTFTDVSVESGIAKVDGRYAMTAVTADYNDDGWPDIFLVNGGSFNGGAFQGGAILAAMALIVMMARLAEAPEIRSRWLRLALIAGPAIFLAIGVAGFAIPGSFLGYPAGWAKPLILFIEAFMTLSIAATLPMLVIGPPNRPPLR
jgi:hypothetical protein